MKIAELRILVASALLFMIAPVMALQPEVLYAFQHEPKNSSARLIQGSDGNFYGTTQNGGGVNGTDNGGTLFRVTTNVLLDTLASFSGGNGGGSESGLILGSDAKFFGTAVYGGSGGVGTVFQVDTTTSSGGTSCYETVFKVRKVKLDSSGHLGGRQTHLWFKH